MKLGPHDTVIPVSEYDRLVTLEQHYMTLQDELAALKLELEDCAERPTDAPGPDLPNV